MREPIVQKAKKIDLKQLRERKLEILTEIRAQKEVVNESFRTIISPFAAGSQNATGIVKKFNTGIAVLDGILIGYNMIRKVRGFFRKFRR